MGGCLYAIPVRMAQGPEWLMLTFFAWGCIEGAWPDLKRVLFREKWSESYARMHYDYDKHWWGNLPALYLHVHVVDRSMHIPDGHWWPREWKKAVGWWALELFMLVCVFL